MDFKYTQNSFSDQSHALTAYAEKMVIKKKPRKLVEHPKLKCLPIPASNVIFNMNNDLAYAFSLCNICDKGEDPKSILFSSRLAILHFEEPSHVSGH